VADSRSTEGTFNHAIAEMKATPVVLRCVTGYRYPINRACRLVHTFDLTFG
jgi:hypothetical protein